MAFKCPFQTKSFYDSLILLFSSWSRRGKNSSKISLSKSHAPAAGAPPLKYATTYSDFLGKEPHKTDHTIRSLFLLFTEPGVFAESRTTWLGRAWVRLFCITLLFLPPVQTLWCFTWKRWFTFTQQVSCPHRTNCNVQSTQTHHSLLLYLCLLTTLYPIYALNIKLFVSCSGTFPIVPAPSQTLMRLRLAWWD